LGDNYEWRSSDARLPKTLEAGEELNSLQYKISDELLFDNSTENLKFVIEYEDTSGKTILTERELSQNRVPSGIFYNLKKGRRRNVASVEPEATSSVGQASSTQPEIENTFSGFQQLVENATWSKELIEDKDVYACDDNALFQIVLEDNSEEFSEPWTQVYPDRNGSGKYDVSLKINGVTIKQLIFVWCDGGRIRVPLPRIKIVGDQRVFYWEANSLEFKIGKLIGNFYIYEDIEGIARMSNIEIA
jgi:hypothetical protein